MTKDAFSCSAGSEKDFVPDAVGPKVFPVLQSFLIPSSKPHKNGLQTTPGHENSNYT